MTILYLSNNLVIQITTYVRIDNIVFRFNWNKPASKLPFPEEIRDSMEEVVLHKNQLTLYLAKVIHLSKPNRERILSKLKANLNNLEEQCGPTPLKNYHMYLKDGYNLLSNKKRDIHLTLIETIWNLWI